MNTLSYNHHDHYETILCHLKRSLISREIYKNVRSSPLSARFCCNGLPTFLIHSQFNIKELVGGGGFLNQDGEASHPGRIAPFHMFTYINIRLSFCSVTSV